MSSPFAVIFDMDGTLIDNNPYHALAWQEFCRRRGMRLTMEIYHRNIIGRPNYISFEFIFERELTSEEIIKYASEKEELYRQLYRPYVKPMRGLVRLLEELSANQVPMGVATSAIPDNIDFLWQHLPLKGYFHTVVDSSMVVNSKPHPETFLKVAERLNIEPERCIAFEDSSAGIEAAKAAGMKVVGLTTSLTDRELADKVEVAIDHYEGLDSDWFSKLLPLKDLEEIK